VWEIDEWQRRKLFAYCGYAGGDWDHCYDALVRTMFASHAGLLILPVQDLLFYGSDTRFNTPGKSDGNWSYRLTREQLKNIDRVKFREWNRMYGRY
jgi:4-alpha-glucanotransferase